MLGGKESLEKLPRDFAGKYKAYQKGGLKVDPLLEGWSKVISPIQMMFYLLFIPSTERNESRAVRLEDLGQSLSYYSKNSAKWLEISNHETLLEFGFCGFKYWGPSSNNSGLITGFDPKPLNAKIGRLLGKRDLEIFTILFWPIMRDLGYLDCEDRCLRHELIRIKPWLDEPFEFEESLFARYLALKGLIWRIYPLLQRLHNLTRLCWEMLWDNGHYPNQILTLD